MGRKVPKHKTIVLRVGGNFQSVQMLCRVERNGCFTIEADFIETLKAHFRESDADMLSIYSMAGERMKIERIRESDNRAIIWPIEHVYGRRGKSKGGAHGKKM